MIVICVGAVTYLLRVLAALVSELSRSSYQELHGYRSMQPSPRQGKLIQMEDNDGGPGFCNADNRILRRVDWLCALLRSYEVGGCYGRTVSHHAHHQRVGNRVPVLRAAASGEVLTGEY